MRRRQIKSLLVFLIIILLSSTSLIQALSIDLKNEFDDFFEDKVESFFEKRKIDTSYNNLVGMEEVEHDIDLIHELYPEYYRDYPMNQSVYLFDDQYEDYHNKLIEEYDFGIPKRLNNYPTEKLDFQNGTTWYVDDVLGEGPGNPPEDFTNIQDAIDVARNGDIIFVYEGKYFGHVKISKSIKLMGENKNSTIIESGTILIAYTDNVHVSGFKIKISEYGIYIVNSQYNIIKENILINNDYGLVISYDDQIERWKDPYFNTLEKNEILYNNIGLLFRETSFNRISGNLIENNYEGIWQFRSFNNNFSENKINNNSVGIYFTYWSLDNKIIGNNITNNKIYGIHCVLSGNISIINNNINSNNDGIYLLNSTSNTIKSNKCNNNKKGIIIHYSLENNLSDNDFSNNYCGIELRNSYLNKIENCTISHNYFFGLYSFGSRYNYITRCDFIDNNDRFKITHYEGEPGDKHFFYRNYWSGRPIQLPIPYLIHIDMSLFPLKQFTFNWDWFPKATPYNYN